VSLVTPINAQVPTQGPTVDSRPSALSPGTKCISQAEERLDALTSLRFFAATMIVVLHTAKFLTRSADDPFAHIALQQGVSFFFVLSGFILVYKYPCLGDGRARLKFWLYRFARVWPAHAAIALLVMLALPLVVWWTEGRTSLWIVGSNLMMLHAFVPDPNFYFGMNPPSWSISCEFFFYLLFPFLLVSWEKNWWKVLISSLAIVALTMVAFSLFGPHDGSVQNHRFLRWLLYINPVVRLFEFVLGMSTALFFVRLRSSRFWQPNRVSVFQAFAIMVTFITIALCSLPIEVSMNSRLPSPLVEWLIGCGGAPAYAFLIFMMAHSTGFCARALSNPVLVWLGEISYSIYLLHYVLLELYLTYLADTCAKLPALLCYSAYWLILLALCALLYYILEKPARKYLPRFILSIVDGRYNSPGWRKSAESASPR